MATITATTPASSFARVTPVQGGSVRVSSYVLGFPARAKKGRVRCCVEEKQVANDMGSNMVMGASLLTAAYAATMSSPALALVDERLSTEGTGLPFGLSNNLLVWIILGVFALIWSLYVVYTSTLEEDEESGLSL